jgi:L-asparaginase/Glu-tRNA(Gln) amidotransferase subunit D
MPDENKTMTAPKPGIEVIYAGGTISSLATPDGYREGGHVVDLIGQLEEHAPGFKDKITLGEAQVAYTGLSENLDKECLAQIDQKASAALDRSPHAALVTHGTDSMEQTARDLQKNFIDRLVAQAAKIIITGANEDLSEENTDAWDNLAFAFESAYGDAEPGVYVAFHRRLIPADKVVKEPFNGREMNYTSVDDPTYIEALAQQKNTLPKLLNDLKQL